MKNLPGVFAAIIVPFYQFCSAPIYVFGKPMKELGVALKVATGYEYDNDCVRLEYGRAEFAVSLTHEMADLGSVRYEELRAKAGGGAHIGPCGSNVYTLRLWNFAGVEALFEATFTCESGDPIPAPVATGVKAAMEEYVHGKRRCSDCGAEVNRGSRNTYFAGIYCDPCWFGQQGQHKGRGGWKKIESEETYD